MSRRARSVVLAGLAALATAGLSACGSLGGSAHAIAPAGATAAPNAAAPAPTAAPAGPATPAAVPAPVPARPAPVPARPGPGGAAPAGGSGGGSGSGGSGGHGSEPAPSAPAPEVTSLRVVQQPACPVHGTPDAPFSAPGKDVVIAWSVSGAKGAAIAVDNPNIYGAYGSDYGSSGQLTLPFGCDGRGTTSHTYTVWPAGAHDVSRTITVSAHSDG